MKDISIFETIRFVDLYYKGIRIRQGWRHLKRDVFFVLFFGVSIPAAFVLMLIHGGLGAFTRPGWAKELSLYILLPSIVVGVAVAGLSFVAVPFWNRLHDLQTLCEMIYTYPLYQVRNYIGNGAMEDGETVKREIQYFPRFYYRRTKGVMKITVRLDDSQFHENGAFENLNKILEDTFVMEVVDMTMRKEYLTYWLVTNGEKQRLTIQEVVPEGYSIPLMRGISWNIEKVPHGLVVGGTGGGKSYFLNTLLKAFVQMGAELYICDPKNSALADYCRIFPRVGVDTAGILDNIKACVRIMEERYNNVKGSPDYIPGQDFTNYSLAPVVLIIDEYTAFAGSLQKKEKEEFKASLSQIVLKGREAGVFVFLATQRPDAEFLSGNVRDQLGLRVTLGSMSDDGYRMAFGSISQDLRKGMDPGQGYMHMPGMPYVRRFYSPYVQSGYDFIEECEKLVRVKESGRSEEESKSVDPEGGSGRVSESEVSDSEEKQ